MLIRNAVASLLLLLLGFGAHGAGAATVPAVLTTSGNSNSWRLTIGANQSATIGWAFSVGAQALEVDALGMYDNNADGMLDAHPVGLWNSSGTLLAQATVPAGTAATRVGSYRYVAIAPVTLAAGQTYVIGAYFAPVVDICGGACGDVSLSGGTETYDARIAFAQSRQTLAIPGAGTLAFPGLNASVPEGFFGPSFLLAADITPDAFSFTAQAGVPLNTTVTSNAITVSGIDSPSPISIVGGTYSINGGGYTAAAGTVKNGDTVTVRQTSSASFTTLTTATLSIGGVNGAFDVTTASADTTPDAFTFSARVNVARNSLVTSNAITVSGIDSASPISIAGGSYAINGGAYTSASGTVNNGDTVTLQQTSSASYATLTVATLTIGGVSGAFDVTTLSAPALVAATPATNALGLGCLIVLLMLVAVPHRSRTR